MNSKLLDERDSRRTFALVFDNGEEPMSGLLRFARSEGLDASHFTGIGAFSAVTVAYFDWQEKSYQDIAVDEQVEVLSLVGNLAVADGEPKAHAHVVLARRDGSALGGHLQRASVRPTLELVVTESPAHLRRSLDPETGLPLLDL